MPVRETSRKTKTAQNKVDELFEVSTAYHFQNLEVKAIDTEQKKRKSVIIDLLEDPEVGETNGKHKERTFDLVGTDNKLLVQLQTTESISTVDNIIDLLRDKVGSEVESFITTVEVLSETALESLLNRGLITEQDILDWTKVKTTNRLIIKEVKEK